MLAITLADFSFIGTANAQAAGAPGGLMSFMPFALILVVMYFLMIRPQSKKAKEHREMVAALKKGDKVVISNGIMGVVTKVSNEAEVTVEIATGVEIQVVRSSISGVVAKNPAAQSSSSSEGTTVKKTTAIKKKAASKSSAKKKTVSK